MLDQLQWLGYGLCHQLPERSFFGGGVQLPVCVRDTGIYVGFVIAFLLLKALHRGARPSSLPSRGPMVLLGLFVLVMAIDGFTSYAGIRDTTNELRLITGLTTGFALAAIVVALSNNQLWLQSASERVLGTPRELLLFVLAVPVSYGALWFLGPMLGVGYPLLVAGSVIFTFVSVNLVIVTLLPFFERKAVSLRDTLFAIMAALALALLQLGFASAFRYWLEQMVASTL